MEIEHKHKEHKIMFQYLEAGDNFYYHSSVSNDPQLYLKVENRNDPDYGCVNAINLETNKCDSFGTNCLVKKVRCKVVVLD